MLSFRSLNAVVLGCALLAGACDRQTDDQAQQQAAHDDSAEPLAGALDRSHKGEPIPDFTLTDADGEKWHLPSLKGQPLLVNLWATWCAPCVKELPTLNSIANRVDVGVKVVTVSEDSGEPDKVQSFLVERGLAQLPAVLDPENDLSFHYKTGTLPTTVLYDADGREIWRYVGGNDWSGAEAMKLLDEGMASVLAKRNGQ